MGVFGLNTSVFIQNLIANIDGRVLAKGLPYVYRPDIFTLFILFKQSCHNNCIYNVLCIPTINEVHRTRVGEMDTLMNFTIASNHGVKKTSF